MSIENKPAVISQPGFDPLQVQALWQWPWSRLGFAYHQFLGACELLGQAGLGFDPPLAALLCLLFASRDQGHLGLRLEDSATLWAERLDAAHHPKLPKLPDFGPGAQAGDLADLLCSSGIAEVLDPAAPLPAGPGSQALAPQAASPLVVFKLGGAHWLQFRGLWIRESQLLELLQAQGAAPDQPAPAALHKALDAWFQDLPAALRPEARQAAAVHQALDHRLFILSGGPGTGKTTTVCQLLLGLYRLHHGSDGAAPPLLALAAPTGRAAARLQESLARSLAALHSQLADPADAGFAAWLGQANGQTLHRLLGQTAPFSPWPQHETVLPHQVLVVDEASMIDIEQFGLLLRRLAPSARLVLIGDPQQLPPVGMGAPLADLISQGRGFAVAELKHCFRVESQEILDAAGEVLAGRLPALPAAGKFRVRPLPEGPGSGQAREQLLQAWLRACELERLAADCHWGSAAAPAAPLDLFQRASRHILLSPVREGPWGTIALNRYILEALRQGPGDWHPGMMAMVTHNDHDRGLFNGDRGLVCRRAGRLGVWFPGSDGSDAAGRWFGVHAIAGLEPAWALTVHKSQGSEYENVWMVLPETRTAEGQASRELLYTGMTRARRELVLAANPASLAAVVARRGERQAPRLRMPGR